MPTSPSPRCRSAGGPTRRWRRTAGDAVRGIELFTAPCPWRRPAASVAPRWTRSRSSLPGRRCRSAWGWTPTSTPLVTIGVAAIAVVAGAPDGTQRRGACSMLDACCELAITADEIVEPGRIPRVLSIAIRIRRRSRQASPPQGWSPVGGRVGAGTGAGGHGHTDSQSAACPYIRHVQSSSAPIRRFPAE